MKKGSVRRYMGFEDFDETFKIFDSLLGKIVITWTVLMKRSRSLYPLLINDLSEHAYNVTDVAPMVSLRGKREMRVNGNDSQGTMGRPVISFPSSIARKFSSRERYLGTRQGQHHSQTKITRKLF